MPKLKGLVVDKIDGTKINRFIEVENFLRSHGFPNMGYELSDILPPQISYFGSYKNNYGLLNTPLAIGFIGAASKYTKYGRELARLLAEATIKYSENALVVSGGAYGIDRAAHKGALDEGGLTVAVVQNPVEYGLSPQGSNPLATRLQNEIPNRGGFVSDKNEYKAPSKPLAISRNYITSALSDIIVVIECDVKSGTIDNAIRAVIQGDMVVVIDWDKIAEVENNALINGNKWLLGQQFDYRERSLRFPTKLTKLQDVATEFRKYMKQLKWNTQPNVYCRNIQRIL